MPKLQIKFKNTKYPMNKIQNKDKPEPKQQDDSLRQKNLQKHVIITNNPSCLYKSNN